MDIKAGVKTTEFWLSIAAFAVGVLLASGVLPVEHWAIKLAGAAAAGLAALGYSISRGSTKGGAGPMAALIPFVLAAALFSSGCCSTPRCYLAKVQVGLEGLDQGAIAAMRAACSPQIEKDCKGKGETCATFVKCRDALVGYEAGRITMGKGVTETNRALEKAGVP